jgi:hypothetical protein
MMASVLPIGINPETLLMGSAFIGTNLIWVPNAVNERIGL